MTGRGGLQGWAPHTRDCVCQGSVGTPQRHPRETLWEVGALWEGVPVAPIHGGKVRPRPGAALDPIPGCAGPT